MSNQQAYEMLDNPPAYAEGVAALCRWSQNYDHPTPYSLFLDLIGYSGEQYGMVGFFPSVKDFNADSQKGEIADWGESRLVAIAQANLIDQRLGFLELGQLADALKEYADRPQDVLKWIEELDEADRADEI